MVHLAQQLVWHWTKVTFSALCHSNTTPLPSPSPKKKRKKKIIFWEWTHKYGFMVNRCYQRTFHCATCVCVCVCVWVCVSVRVMGERGLTQLDVSKGVVQVHRGFIIHQHLYTQSALEHPVLQPLGRKHQFCSVVSGKWGSEWRPNRLPGSFTVLLTSPPLSVFKSVIAVDNDVAGQLKT